jgi:BolA protein
MRVSDQITDRLTAALAPERLELTDESERHRGHAGYQEGGQSHFHLTIRAAALDGMSRIERHRAIHRAIGPDLIARIHALSIDVE